MCVISVRPSPSWVFSGRFLKRISICLFQTVFFLLPFLKETTKKAWTRKDFFSSTAESGEDVFRECLIYWLLIMFHPNLSAGNVFLFLSIPIMFGLEWSCHCLIGRALVKYSPQPKSPRQTTTLPQSFTVLLELLPTVSHHQIHSCVNNTALLVCKARNFTDESRKLT